MPYAIDIRSVRLYSKIQKCVTQKCLHQQTFASDDKPNANKTLIQQKIYRLCEEKSLSIQRPYMPMSTSTSMG